MTGKLTVRSPLGSLIPSRETLFQPFEDYFNSLFDQFFSDAGTASVRARAGYPRWDVLQDNGQWIVEVGLSGVKPEDVSVEIVPFESPHLGAASAKEERRVLKISGRMSDDRQYGEDTTYHVKELRRSAFERSMVLPEYVKGEPVATMQDGILRLVWDCPQIKRPERKKIAIQNLDSKAS